LEAARRFADKAYHDRIRDEEAARVSAWHEGIAKRDMGLAGGGPPWFDPALDDSSWRTMKIPAFLDEGGMGPVNGVVWFRKHVDVPASMTGRPALLRLGRIVDSDTAYMNGVCVGTVGYQYPPRRYEVPDNLLLPGRNTIAVRVVSSFGRGGFIKDKPYQLEAGGEAVDLRGDWRCRIGTVEEPLVEPIRILCKPLGLFNAMIAPLLSYSMKGVIWYQGESNDSRPEEYRGLFSAMIRDWRSKWKLGDFPFLYVQLHNFMEPQDLPSESSWALLREAQLHSLSIPNTAMATAVDLGEWNDLHPLRKRDVGYRLALAAFKTAYGDEGVVYSGPLYWSKKTEGGAIRISFTHVGGGLRARDGELRHFAICGPDGRFVWARAEIQDNSVLVRSDRIKRPVAVRYAWADNPEKANLYNAEGLPASPFRTDGA
jgi:sialate O-acetylesterase